MEGKKRSSARTGSNTKKYAGKRPERRSKAATARERTRRKRWRSFPLGVNTTQQAKSTSLVQKQKQRRGGAKREERKRKQKKTRTTLRRRAQGQEKAREHVRTVSEERRRRPRESLKCPTWQHGQREKSTLQRRPKVRNKGKTKRAVKRLWRLARQKKGR